MDDSNTTTNGTDIAVGICYEQYIAQDAYVTYYSVRTSRKVQERCGFLGALRCTRTRYS